MIGKSIADIKFVRRTSLKENESRCNFRQIDQDAINVVTSREARQVTTMMSQVYLCIINAPFKFLVAEGELRFCGEFRDGKQMTAWEQLTETLGVADGTALKALKFMHEHQVIGYYAGKNGVGIRIFINRAETSIKSKQEPQKNLPGRLVANGETRTSRFAVPLKTGLRESLDNEVRTFAPEDGAGIPADFAIPDEAVPAESPRSRSYPDSEIFAQGSTAACVRLPSEIIDQIAAALSPTFRCIAEREAARQAERTREWLERYGVPKAARVAQNEAFKIHLHQTKLKNDAERLRRELTVGSASAPPGDITAESAATRARPKIAIAEAIEICRTAHRFHGADGSTAALASLINESGITHDDAAEIRKLLDESSNEESEKARIGAAEESSISLAQAKGS